MVLLFVGDDVNDHNLLQKGRPLIMRNRVLVGPSSRFSNFPAAGVDRYKLKVPLPEKGKGTD